MYFLNTKRTLCHILEDEEDGRAPAPCGAKVKKTDMLRRRDGRQSNVVAVKPPDVPLCKHCEKAGAVVLV